MFLLIVVIFLLGGRDHATVRYVFRHFNQRFWLLRDWIVGFFYHSWEIPLFEKLKLYSLSVYNTKSWNHAK